MCTVLCVLMYVYVVSISSTMCVICNVRSVQNIIQLSLKSPQVLADVRKDLFHVLHQEPARVVVMQQVGHCYHGNIP